METSPEKKVAHWERTPFIGSGSMNLNSMPTEMGHIAAARYGNLR
jgi:hypothetical protein